MCCRRSGAGSANTISTSTVGGTIRGASFHSDESFSATLTLDQNSGTIGAIEFVDGATDECTLAPKHEGRPNMKVLAIGVGTDAHGKVTAPTGPGTFSVTTTNDVAFASVQYFTTDANCQLVGDSGAMATAGTVTLTAANANGYAGSGDVMIDSGDHVTFTFVAPNCPGYLSPGTIACAM